MTDLTERPSAAVDSRAMSNLLVRVGQARDRQAFRALFDHFAPRIRSFLLQRRVPKAQAEDITQDVMLAVWRRAASFDPAKAGASTWIYTIARNQHIDQFRKAKRAEQMDETDPSLQPEPAPAADDLCEMSESAQSVGAALETLSPDQRQVIDMAFTEGLSHSEIADRLDLPLGTVKSRIRLAMGKLKTTLGDLV
ncbi:sigma-70 family RNA polymerase sigma factor [Maricaulis sp.]|uniref:sigma-70 family RNA polymerase sigma factor n=1 Tax=Maricaulis sp. TaxID=1486257 RepID=UPI0025CBDCB7|nr:sigma-70 family RNA polymerase sigma factor [Maricaulis sp.]MDF1768707.1 sigma-70 family RNA polymerase sigma factor [Maricaulis sp.]